MNINKYTIHSGSVSIREAGKFAAISLTAVVIALLAGGCAPGNASEGPPYSVDLQPPVLLSAETRDERHLAFIFNEETYVLDEVINTIPPIPIITAVTDKEEVLVGFGEDQGIGTMYTIRMNVCDLAGNSLSFLYNFSGWNPRVPEILFNEINPRGSGNTPDCIELLTLSDGNLGGLCLRVGTENEFSEELLFPAIEISAGDYILAHAKSEGLTEEVDELEGIDVSGGLLAHDNARDFWIPGSPGLPGNNGALSLYSRKGGPLIDSVIWSDRVYDPSDEKLGWTNIGYIFAEDLAAAEAWEGEWSEIPSPSDAVDVSLSTATRSLCRNTVPDDSNCAEDWHTVPTRGQTFGVLNTDAVYIP